MTFRSLYFEIAGCLCDRIYRGRNNKKLQEKIDDVNVLTINSLMIIDNLMYFGMIRNINAEIMERTKK